MAGEAEAAGAEHTDAFPPFDATLFPAQLFWFAVSFIALYVLMARVVLPRVAHVLELRAATIKGDVDAAAAASAAAESARLSAEKSAADARAKARETIDAMRAKAQAEYAVEQAKVEKTIAERAAAAEAALAQTRAAEMAQIGPLSEALAQNIAARVSGGIVGAA